MKKTRKSRKTRILSLLACLLTAATLLSACGGATASGSATTAATAAGGTAVAETTAAGSEAPLKLRFMMMSFSQELAKDDSPVLQAIEKYTNTDLTVEWVPDATYGDKLNIVLASGDMPEVMVADKTSSIINAARAGALWEVGPYLKDYPNLSQANELVLNNISIDSKVYGVYRARDLGRNGINYRKDWLANVGLAEPKTLDDFYNMLVAFTKNDPDKDGKDDTVGMVVTKWSGPWDIIQLWHGASNKWGEDATGHLVPNFYEPEYMEGLKFCQKIYGEGLVNEDFAVLESSKWEESYLNETSGIMVDVMDFSRRIQEKFENQLGYKEIVWDVAGTVEAPAGKVAMPTAGYAKMICVTKAVKDEATVKRVLGFLDKLNDTAMQDMMNYGIEGRHYELKDGAVSLLEDPDQKLAAEKNDLAQMGMAIGPMMTPLKITPLREKITATMKANEEIVVANPVLPYVSDTYSQKGPQLDKIIEDARIKFIVGQLDEAGFQEAVALWKTSGGEQVIAEYDAEYQKYKTK